MISRNIFHDNDCVFIVRAGNSDSYKQAEPLVAKYLEMMRQLQESKFAPLVTLGNTLESWQKEIVRMWRFSKTNSITEGLHRRIDEILNRAYGMRNFNNFRIRVKAYAG